MNRILLASPHMGGNEMKYIQDAFDKNWIAPLGENVNEFEKSVKEYVGRKEALAVSSGTAAIHLGLKALGVGEGDYVVCSSLTFSASANPILYEKAIPVFVDSEEKTWNMSPSALRKALEWCRKEGHPAKAVVVVDLYGQSADYEEILEICHEYGAKVLEDSAEALGTEYKGRRCGNFGDISILSFNGNKIITTSGGGMVLCDDKETRDRMFKWSTQSRENTRWYQHEEIGYNYRMSNICAGIGRGQMEVLDERISKKREIFKRYSEGFKGLSIKMMDEFGYSTHWLSVMALEDDRNTIQLIEELEKNGIEARPVWKPMHMQPVFEKYPYFKDGEDVSRKLFERGICLPSDTKMNVQEQDEVIEIVKGWVQNEE